jgi:hypothetical protein
MHCRLAAIPLHASDSDWQILDPRFSFVHSENAGICPTWVTIDLLIIFGSSRCSSAWGLLYCCYLASTYLYTYSPRHQDVALPVRLHYANLTNVWSSLNTRSDCIDHSTRGSWYFSLFHHDISSVLCRKLSCISQVNISVCSSYRYDGNVNIWGYMGQLVSQGIFGSRNYAQIYNKLPELQSTTNIYPGVAFCPSRFATGVFLSHMYYR